MTDNNVLKLSQPTMFSNPLTEVLRSGAESLLVQSVEVEAVGFLGSHATEGIEEGRQRLNKETDHHSNLVDAFPNVTTVICLASTNFAE